MKKKLTGLEKYGRSDYPKGIADDSCPVFVLKAKDVYAVDILDFYEFLCWKNNNKKMAISVAERVRYFERWREANERKVKVPDVPDACQQED